MKTKRAEYSNIIMWTVVILFLMALFMILVGRLMKGGADYIDDETCKKSIAANAEARLKWSGTDFTSMQGKVMEIKCSTKYQTIISDDEKTMKMNLADSMAKCWEFYGKDGYEIFNTDDGNYCVVCSRLEFKNPKKLDEFSRYLIENKYNDKTYFEYLYDKKLPADFSYDEANSMKKGLDSISTEKPLGVVFIMSKDANLGKPIAGAIGAVAGLAVGGVLTATGVFSEVGIPIIIGSVAAIGAGGGTIGFMAGSDKSATFQSRIVVWPYDDIKSLNCTSFEGKAHGLQVVE